MASFFQSLQSNGIFHSWEESRRKSNTGWILLSMGVIIFALSFLFISYSIFLIIGAILPFLLGVLLIIQGKLNWKHVVNEFEPTSDLSVFDIFNQKIQSLPFIVVYESENPAKAAAIFTYNNSFILPLTSNDDINIIIGNFSEQMNRILPLPWQQPTMLEPVRDSMELEAAIHRIMEESPNSQITLPMLETVYQFAKVIHSFILIGRPLPPFNGTVNVNPQNSATSEARNKPQRTKNRSIGFNIGRFKWLIFLCVFIGIGYGTYYYSGQIGLTSDTTYRDEFKKWLAVKLPLEYHSYIGLGTLQNDIEQNIKAVTIHSTPVFDKVGGGQVLNHLAKNTEVNVIQEELVGNTYWYYMQEDNVMGWVKNSDLVFKHLLPAKTAYYSLPAIKESQLSPKRPIPFAIRQKYITNGEEWWGIRGFESISDVVWVRKGDYK